VRFSICDEGPGIAEDQLPKLFRKFSQLEESDTRSTGGSGLGLAICKAIVDAHGGVIGVESQPGVGSRFHFEIGESESDRPVRRFRAESGMFRKRRSRTGDQRSDAVLDLVESALALIGTPTSDDDRRLARELYDQASSLARRRGLPVPVRSNLIRVASSLASLAVLDRAADERAQRHALAEALRSLEDEASRYL
jgi:hypothetical protein